LYKYDILFPLTYSQTPVLKGHHWDKEKVAL